MNVCDDSLQSYSLKNEFLQLVLTTRFLWHCGRKHVSESCCSRTKMCVPKHDFPILLNFIDVQRQTETSLDVLHDVTVDDYWNMDGDKSIV